jgi:hypothetical protein
MPGASLSPANVETIASFPTGYFLENLAMRRDRSLLVTVLNKRELWYVPPVDAGAPIEPVRLQVFDHNATGICEIDPDVFLIAETDFYAHKLSRLRRLDLNGWTPGLPISAEIAFTFPPEARGLNGMCRLGSNLLLVADSFAGCIWRVDRAADGEWAARSWLTHASMTYFPGAMKPEQPGVNGVRYAARTSYLYFTATAKKLLMRAHVNPWTFEPDGHVELVVAGRMFDDFCIDEDAGCLYATTHRQNTIDRVSMDVAVNSDFPDVVAGDPFDEDVIGPSSLVWGTEPDERGRVLFAITDGGTASPAAGGPRPAKLLRVTLPLGVVSPNPRNF